MFHERGTVYEFANLVKELETAGVLYSDKVSVYARTHASCICLQPYIYIHIHTNPHPNGTRTQQYPFDFPTVDKPYETYTGLNVRLRYFLRVTVTTKTAYVPNLVAEQDLLVQTTTEVCGGL